MQKQIIILLGQPGAGKGTQAQLLSEKFSYYYFETSKILEGAFSQGDENKSFEIEGKTYSLKEEKDLWLKGILCSPPFVTNLVTEKIKELAEDGRSIILSGSPRTLYEGEKVTPVLFDLYGKENIKVVLIEISAEATIFRNSHRKICELMRHPILYSKETEPLLNCPLDGSKLLKREGLDDPETIKIRIKEYVERTLPLIDYFTSQGLEVKKIKGEQTVADVFKDVLSAL